MPSPERFYSLDRTRSPMDSKPKHIHRQTFLGPSKKRRKKGTKEIKETVEKSMKKTSDIDTPQHPLQAQPAGLEPCATELPLRLPASGVWWLWCGLYRSKRYRSISTQEKQQALGSSLRSERSELFSATFACFCGVEPVFQDQSLFNKQFPLCH